MVKSVRQLDREAFAQVDRMVAGFAQSRFGNIMPELAKGFFAGARDQAETKLPEIQQAFALFFVYGYRDRMDERYDHHLARAIDLATRRPWWRLSLQLHKLIGVP